jgi:hypothetical protein
MGREKHLYSERATFPALIGGDPMSRQTRTRVFSFLMLLGVLTGILALPVQNADAAICCSSCDSRYYSCLAGRWYLECNGDPSCCDEKVSGCWAVCSFSC